MLKSVKILILIVILVVAGSVSGQQLTYDGYILKYSDLAVREMNKYKIPASITLAQGLLESGAGNSELALNANNHFGIKCQKEWQGKTYRMDDDEKDECFRKYDSPEESYRDHSLFLTTRERYASLFRLDLHDYKAWARGLKDAGYATNPRYAEMLIRIIEENELYRFDGREGDRERKADSSQQPAVGSPQEDIRENADGEGTYPPVSFYRQWVSGREIYLNNHVKFIYAAEGDTWQEIAVEFGIYGWQVRKYNELKTDEQPAAGEKVYIEHKRNRSSVPYHKVLPGETMRNISQDYAVKRNVFYRLNGMKKGTEPPAGTVLKLRKTKD